MLLLLRWLRCAVPILPSFNLLSVPSEWVDAATAWSGGAAAFRILDAEIEEASETRERRCALPGVAFVFAVHNEERPLNSTREKRREIGWFEKCILYFREIV